ncbi:MAG: hypothetical protein HKN12_00190, partial [Gemmatimonadetes bacterium]|nr:hypothetical protein [Gemmatimonadota bacterium]
ETIKLQTIAETLETLAHHPIDGVYTSARAVVEKEVLAGVRARLLALDLGVEVLRFAIRDVHAPPEVHAAFRDVASAQEDKQTAINVALRYQVETVNLARGDAAREVEIARSFQDAEVKRATGESKSLDLRSEAFRERPVGNRKRAYLETMEEILANSRKIIRPGWKGSGGVDLWISPREGTPLPMGEVLRGSEIRQAERTPAGGE